ncbi:MAG: molybdenum cofactor biosynthesis protein MoaE [Thermodesulfobacteriota bacterium]|nr:molybdenum cofactor biosynthesis protein MoaE [Thermodesulfobacteriota bacterium]
MDASKLIEKIKSHPKIADAGMILCHNGLVRATSRGGQKVSAVEVKVDQQRLAKVLQEIKKQPGIVEFLAEVREGRFSVGDDLMILVIAGDFRENVIAAMTEAINFIKKNVVTKKEIFAA